ncbi:hypothetical protein DFH94DRAFT_795843 [Russula ochroleuca]|uniref:Endoplasmic reticulum junction formation protein lunapark n=1 Tax=Russula ochroleuca TaxID=152965 RepID=A0A9P5JXR1_9AGAM|nr:hypothetical protein DFH94DRAFT_795843 [Russula ochroleuca]
MGLLTWFKKKKPEDIGQVLATLASDIQKRETRLNEIRLRERRATLLVTLYTFAGWGAYLGLWYTQLLPQMSGHRPNSQVEKAVKGFPAILGPIMILFTRRIVQLWYNRKGNAEEKSLAALKLARRNKVEDFKKRTNYYETRELLERYEDGPSTGVPPARPIDDMSSRRQSQLLATPQRAAPATAPNTPTNLRNPPISPGLQSQLTQTPQPPLSPPRKLWYDKLADALLGDDGPSVNAAASRYALICQKCFAHNGLVKEDMWEDTQYVCPKCGYFNPSTRSQRKGFHLQPHTPTMQTPSRPEPRDASPQNAPRPPKKFDGSPESGGSTIATRGKGRWSDTSVIKDLTGTAPSSECI